jgi:hypothetical protein
MDEQRAAEIQNHLKKRLPDCRISTAYDFDKEAQRFKIRHSRVVTHYVYVEEAAVERYSPAELLKLLDQAVDRLRLTGSQAQIRVSAAGVRLL